MTDKTEAQPEALRLANNRPHSLDDDLYAWALSAEYAIREQHVEIERLCAQLVTQTNRAAAAEQQVTALTQRLDTANALNTEARNELAQLQLSARQAVSDWDGLHLTWLAVGADVAGLSWSNFVATYPTYAAPPPPEREPLPVDFKGTDGINARLHYRRGWREAERAHGIGAPNETN